MLDWVAGGGFLSAGGKRLEWAGFGERRGNGPVIVLLHEGLGCVALWRDFPRQLAAATGLAVFAYSRAGYGQSDGCDLPRPLDYMTREAVEVLPGVLDALGAGRVILMGHSDGATIASEHAGRVRDARVAGLVLMAPHFFAEPMGLAEIARAKSAFEATDLREKMARYHRDPDMAFRGWNDAWLDPDFARWNVAASIERIAVPALVIQGREDQYGTLAQVEAFERCSQAPVDVLVLDECRHAPHFDQPGEVIGAVKGFAESVPRCDQHP